MNKDGKPRKKGSGKTIGAGCYAKIPWSDLKKFIGSEVSIPVSRVWLRNLNADLDKYVDQSPNSLPEPSVDESLPPSTGTAETLPDSTPEVPTELEEIVAISESEPLKSDDSSDFAETEIPSVPELGPEETKDTPEEEDSQHKAKDENEEIATGNSLAGIAYRYSQNFDL
ncbi:MAG: hypothetical protein O3A82_04290 [Verrucomicrobia bacterium]|nr:hypothetical protein [Verrucomicrobiota bacterium]MDA1046131.1 hypothetical protein [Verrucomicrobiota bacterium]